MEKNIILDDREAIVRILEPIAKQFDPGIHWQGEDTILNSAAFGGIMGWLNREVFFARNRSGTYKLGMPLRQLIDQFYVGA
ncbi:hypothetical protein C4585_01855 [Candidatus Parcubacteria bacterium]|nr:MAG: hypothetical protein C4585_01855 [Candidatus Parcubacteria bacterium]